MNPIDTQKMRHPREKHAWRVSMPTPRRRPDSNYQKLDEPALVVEPDEGFPRSTALCRYLWPSAIVDTIQIEYIGEGGSNRVFGLSFVENDETSRGQVIRHDLVIRITSGQEFVLPTVAILQYLETYTPLGAAVPRVIKWDTTRNNPLGFGYIILSRIPGKSLDKIWDYDLSEEQKEMVAAQLATLYLRLESVTSPVAGDIMVHQKGFIQGHSNVEDFIFLQPLGTPDDPLIWGTELVGKNNKDRILLDSPGLSVEMIMHGVISRSLYRTERRPADIAKYRAEKEVLDSVVANKLFNAENNIICLHHPDLHPGNIMVDFTDDNVPVITGVVDWDSASFVPRFATRVIPDWLQWDKTKNKRTDRYASIFKKVIGEDWTSEAEDKLLDQARSLLESSSYLSQILSHLEESDA